MLDIINLIDDGVTPAAPTGLTAAGGIQYILLEWNQNAEPDISHYEVWRNTVDDSGTASKISDINATTFADGNLPASTTYYYWLKAVDYPGNISPFSNGANAEARNVGHPDIAAAAVEAAQTSITSINPVDGEINANKVGTLQINNGAVTELKVLDDAITAAKVAVAGLNGTTGDVSANHIVANMLQTGCVVSDKIYAGAVTANKITALNFVLSEGSFANDTPDAGKLAWTSCKIVYNGTEYSITDGNCLATDKHIYWQLASPTVFSASATLPVLGNDDFLVVFNNSGTALYVWNSTIINGNRITTGSITATNIAGNTITGNEITGTILSGIFANLGTITAGNMTLNSAGFIRTDGKDNYADNTAGIWFGYDTDKYKLNIGSDTNYLKWDGSNLTIVGNITIGNPGDIKVSDLNNDLVWTDDTAADAAQDELDDIAAGTEITPVEKLAAKRIWDTVVVEGTATTGTIPAAAIAVGVSTTNFDTDYAALDTYLDDEDIFDSMGTTTSITRADWDTAWKNYFDERTKILNVITADVTFYKINGGLSLTGGGLELASGNAAFKGGQTAYNTGTGFWLGDVSGTHKFSIGDPAGNHLKWDGSNLSISGIITLAATSSGIANFSDGGDLVTMNESAIDLDNITEGTTNKFFTATAETKLGTIDANADVTGDNLPTTLNTPATTGLFLSSTYLGYWQSDSLGSAGTQFDITDEGGDTFRYTYDGLGDNPLITTYIRVGTQVIINGDFNANNNGIFTVTGVDTDYFEVTNASGVAENDVDLGAGFLKANNWNSYIDSSGKFFFRGDGNNSIDWDITNNDTLTIKGDLVSGTITSADGLSHWNLTDEHYLEIKEETAPESGVFCKIRVGESGGSHNRPGIYAYYDDNLRTAFDATEGLATHSEYGDGYTYYTASCHYSFATSTTHLNRYNAISIGDVASDGAAFRMHRERGSLVPIEISDCIGRVLFDFHNNEALLHHDVTGIEIYAEITDNTYDLEDVDLVIKEIMDGTSAEVLRLSYGNITQIDNKYFATDQIQARDSGGLNLFEDSGAKGLSVTDSGDVVLTDDLRLGIADVGAKLIIVSGDATGSAEGGEIRLEMAADHDGTYDFWQIDVYEDDLRFGVTGATRVTFHSDGTSTFTGCISDGTCENMNNEDAVEIIKDINSKIVGIQDGHGHFKQDLSHVYSKYPFMVVKQKVDGETKYFDKLGAKSDLCYSAITQLYDKIKVLEDRIIELEKIGE